MAFARPLSFVPHPLSFVFGPLSSARLYPITSPTLATLETGNTGTLATIPSPLHAVALDLTRFLHHPPVARPILHHRRILSLQYFLN